MACCWASCFFKLTFSLSCGNLYVSAWSMNLSVLVMLDLLIKKSWQQSFKPSTGYASLKSKSLRTSSILLICGLLLCINPMTFKMTSWYFASRMHFSPFPLLLLMWVKSEGHFSMECNEVINKHILHNNILSYLSTRRSNSWFLHWCRIRSELVIVMCSRRAVATPSSHSKGDKCILQFITLMFKNEYTITFCSSIR